MDPHATRRFRASIVARARFIEDLVVEQAGHGVSRYVILGAGLDTFAQRRPEIAISFFPPSGMLALARDAGFRNAQHVSGASLARRYFGGRTDGLRPSSAEELLVATS